MWPGAEHFGRNDFFSTSANDYFLLKRKQKEMLAEGNEILSEVDFTRGRGKIIIKNRDSEGYNPIQLRWHSPIFPSPAGKSVEGNGE